jgi:hypothetical protein
MRNAPLGQIDQGPDAASKPAGVMPPWYIEKSVGIQRYKNDVSLSEEELAKISRLGRTTAHRAAIRRHAAAAHFCGRQVVANRHARSHRGYADRFT